MKIVYHRKNKISTAGIPCLILELCQGSMGAVVAKHRIIIFVTGYEKYAYTLRYVDVGYCENNYPEQSSGGEQQRAAICRAIIKSPKLILADEPTGSLDHVNAKAILSTFMDIKERMQTTIVLVTHDAAAAIVLQLGQTIVDGYTKGSMVA